jgi:hypothetical protein
VTKFEAEASTSNKFPADVIPGRGSELGEIDNVNKAITKLKATDRAVLAIYSVCFPGAKRDKNQTKKVLRKFSGFAGDDVKQMKEDARDKLGKKQLADLKRVAAVLDLDMSGAKGALVDRIVAYLDKPKSSGRDYVGVSGSTRGGGSAKGKGTKRKTGRTTAFFLYSGTRRPALREDNPEMKVTEIASLLGEEWRAMSDSEQNKWKKKADAKNAAKASSEGSEEDESPKKKRRGSSKKGSSKKGSKKSSKKKKGSSKS